MPRFRVRTTHLIIAPAAVLSVTGAMIYALSGGFPATPDARQETDGRVHTIALRAMSSAAGQGKVMGLPASDTKPFSLLGVSWANPRTELAGTVQVRTRATATGTWSPWRPVAAEDDDRPDPGARADRPARRGTEPLWVGPSNGVQVRVAGKASAVLPPGLRVDLIDPGDGRKPGPRAAGRPGADGPGEMALAGAFGVAQPATPDPSTSPTAEPSTGSPPPAETATPTPSEPSSPSPSASATSSPSPSASPPATPTVAAGSAPRPAIVSRAQWGADETLVKNPPEYGSAVKVVFAHHTAGTNDYSCSESPAIIRAIMLYHVRTNGWNDVGYHFFADKCGTIFEGRKGGADRPVIGAQTYGFNTDSAGVAVLGDFRTVVPAQAAQSAVAKVAAWKLGLHGGDPSGTATLTERATDGKYPYGTNVTFNTIAGHRDGFATECPGAQLYARLPAIRTEAKAWTTPLTSVAPTSLSGATKVGSTYYTKGAVTVSWKPAAASAYTVLVDGAVAAKVSGDATSAKVTLAAGTHTLQLRATNLDGTTVTSPDYPVIADVTAPVFTTAPALSLRAGSVSAAGSSPVTLGWKVSDNRLLQSLKATSPTATAFTTTTTSWSSYAKANTAQAWSLTAADAAGNAATSAITRTASIYHETSSVRTGTWKTATGTSYLGGKSYYTGVKGATASYTFTGRSVGLIVRKAASAGAFSIYVDGVKVATIDARASSTVYRQVVWTKSWTGSAKHTIKIVAAGTSGRPYVVTDGIAYIK